MSNYVVDSSAATGDRKSYNVEISEMTKLFETIEFNENGLSIVKRLSDETLWMQIPGETQATLIPMKISPYPFVP